MFVNAMERSFCLHDSESIHAFEHVVMNAPSGKEEPVQSWMVAAGASRHIQGRQTGATACVRALSTRSEHSSVLITTSATLPRQ